MEMQPDDAETYIALPDCQIGLQDFPEALRSLRRAEQFFERVGNRDGVAWIGERIRGMLGAP